METFYVIVLFLVLSFLSGVFANLGSIAIDKLFEVLSNE